MSQPIRIFAKLLVAVGIFVGIIVVAVVAFIGTAAFRHSSELNNLKQESSSFVAKASGTTPSVAANDCRDVELQNECDIKTATTIDISAASKALKDVRPGPEENSYTFPSSKYDGRLLHVRYTSHDINTYYVNK